MCADTYSQYLLALYNSVREHTALAWSRSKILHSAWQRAERRALYPRSLLWRQMPRMGGKELDLYKLYRSVTALGGCAKVTADKKWRVRGLSAAHASTGFTTPSAGACIYILSSWALPQLC